MCALLTHVLLCRTTNVIAISATSIHGSASRFTLKLREMSRLSDLKSDESILDQANRARTEKLALKLARLKNVAVDIEEETRDHIPMLDDVDNSYERTFAALKSGQNRLANLLRSNRKSRRLFCYSVLIFSVILIILYYWLANSTTT